MRKTLQSKIAGSRRLLPVAYGYMLLICLAETLRGQDMWLQLLLLTATTLLMVKLNNDNALIRIYSRMVSATFIVLIMAGAGLAQSVAGDAFGLMMTAFYVLLFRTYQQPDNVKGIFSAFFFLGLASLFWPKAVWLLPLMWLLAATVLMSLSLRGFLASLIGVFLPYWFYAGWCVYSGHIERLTAFPATVLAASPVADMSWLDVHSLALAGLVTVAAAAGAIHFVLNAYQDRIRTRMLFNFFIWSGLASLLLLLVQPHDYDFIMRLLILNSAPLIGHLLALTRSRLSNIFFALFFILAWTLTALSLWTS